MQEEIYKTLLKKRKKFYNSVPRALKFEDPEDIHQLRVAGRTVLATIDLMASEDDHDDPRFKKMRGPLKKAMSMLGQLRDADVMIGEIEKRLPAMAQAQRDLLEGWLEGLRSERQKLRRKAARKLPQIIDAGWKKRTARWQRAKASSPTDPSRFTQKLGVLRASRAQAFQAIRESLSGPVSFDDDELLDQLHHGRIATKKLRYALETMAPFTDPDDEEIRQLKTVQDQLGHVQDLRTWAHKLLASGGDQGVISGILAKWQDEMNARLQQTDLSVKDDGYREVCMKSLYVIRHGIAQKRGEGVDDEARELTRKGRDRMKLVAKGLADTGVRLDVILTSPLARALQTARIVEKYCTDGPSVTETDLLKPDASFDALIEQLNGLEGADGVAIVGHEPDLSSFISYCIADKKSSFIRLKKGGVALLETEGAVRPGQCLLAWLLEPGQLIRL